MTWIEINDKFSAAWIEMELNQIWFWIGIKIKWIEFKDSEVDSNRNWIEKTHIHLNFAIDLKDNQIDSNTVHKRGSEYWSL